jgi:nucleolar complex protein 2
VDLPVSDEEEEDDWEDGEEADEEEEEVKGGSKKKAKQHVDQLKRLQEKVRLLSFWFLRRSSVAIDR